MIAFIMPIDLPTITLILPGLQTLASAQHLPALEKLIARGSGLQQTEADARGPLERWQSQLLHELALSSAQFPSAAVTCLGLGPGFGQGFGLSAAAAEGPGTWMHVTPMHMSVALNGLSLHPVPTWSALQVSTIEARVAQHCREDGFDWQRQGNAVFLHRAASLQVETVAAELAYRFPLRDVQPQGPDASRINQLSTELQMLLHEHPVLARGSAAPINALWLWGNGVLPVAHSKNLPQAWSDEPYVRGVYQLSGRACNHLVAFDQIEADGNNALVVARLDDIRIAESQWFAPLLDRLQNGKWRAARVFLDDWHFTINRHQLWRVWRRSQSLSTLVNAKHLHTTLHTT
jgi:hypothetical protein